MTVPKGRKPRMRALLVCGVFIVLGIYGAIQIFVAQGTPDTPQIVLDPVPSMAVEEEEHTFTIVAFGDSVTAGLGLSLPEAYPAQLEQLLQTAGYDAVVKNAGVSGETSAGGLRRASFIAEQNPDIVLLALGGNDVLRGLDPKSTKENLRTIIKLFREQKITVVLVGMYAPSNLGQEYSMEFNTLYPQLAQEFNIPLVPFLLEGIVFNKELNQDDGIHPNKVGAEIIARDVILPVLTRALDSL